MPTQTKFICPSGGVNVDFSGVFEELNGGTAYGSATNFKVGSSDINTLFHASTRVNDRPSFNTGYKIGANDLSTIFRRRGFTQYTLTVNNGSGGGTQNAGYSYSIVANAPSTGYSFSNWSGQYATFVDAGLSDTNCTITSSTTVTANYSPNNYTLTAIFADIVGGVSPYNSNGDISGKTVVYGSTYEVTARSYSGYTFSHWQTNTSPHNLTYVEGTSYTDETIKITIGAINTEIEAIYTED